MRCVLVLSVCLLWPASQAQEPVAPPEPGPPQKPEGRLLRLKLNQGDVFFYRDTIKSTIKQRLGDVVIEQDAVTRYSVEKVAEDGTVTLKARVVYLHFKQSFRGEVLEFDSRETGKATLPEPQKLALKRRLEHDLTLTLASDGAVKDLTGWREMLKDRLETEKLSGVDPKESERIHKETLSPLFLRLPAKPVKAGDTWESASRGLQGRYRERRTLQSLGGDTFTVKMEVTGFEVTSRQILFQIKRLRERGVGLTIEGDGEGEAEGDAATGLPRKMKSARKWSIKIGGRAGYEVKEESRIGFSKEMPADVAPRKPAEKPSEEKEPEKPAERSK